MTVAILHIRYNTLPYRLCTVCIAVFTMLLQGCREQAGKTSRIAKAAISINDSLTSSGRSRLQDGDLLMRSDDDFESLSLQNFSQKDRTYSHSGMVFLEDSSWWVYHSMAGAENPGESLKREAFDSFVNPLKKTGFGIFRYALQPAEIDSLHRLYQKYYAERMPFDKSFNLSTNDSMYCSEIIFKSLQKVTQNRIILPTSVLTNFKPKTTSVHFKNTFFKRFEYIGLDDLYMNSFCKKIFTAQFK